MAELRRLHDARVREEEIDHLGHMNVRFYLEKALRATDALLARHGLGPDACAELGGRLDLCDAFTRHYREQLVGAELAVLGGALAVEGDGLRVYHELVNEAREERAATFVHALVLRDRESGAPRALPEMVVHALGRELVELPAHGGPRTLDLDLHPPRLTLAEAQRRGIATRRERVVGADECDADGTFRPQGYQGLVWGGDPVDPSHSGMPVWELPGGGRFGWATLESRGSLHGILREGTRIQSFGAEVAIADKTSVRHQWVFDVERDELVCTSSIVNLAFDLGARKAIPIPDGIRASLESRFHPDLR